MLNKRKRMDFLVFEFETVGKEDNGFSLWATRLLMFDF